MSRHLTIPAADTQLHAVDAPGGTPALLFLGGGFGTVRNWSRVIRSLDGSTAWCGSTHGRAGSRADPPTTP
jgi:pimeloyl-ACP methyl ester carboxylesterase